MHRARRKAGFTAIEVMIVVAILGVAAAAAVPSWRTMAANARLRDATGDITDALRDARARSIATRRNFVVYFNTGVTSGVDVCGNDLIDLMGAPVPILMLEDRNGNCCIDPGEVFETWPAAEGVQWGTDFATSAAPGDPDPSGSYNIGSTLHNPANSQTEWVAFEPDGIPKGFSNGGACTLGTAGTGGGAIYINNDRRDVAVVLTPLGALKVHGFERSGGVWTD
jgi:prepilin-type N-terminal cleavage/methylation domain-containing protein